MQSAARLEIVDDRDGNIVSVKESYTLSAQALAANDLAKNFPIKAADVGNCICRPRPSSAATALSPSAHRSTAVTA